MNSITSSHIEALSANVDIDKIFLHLDSVAREQLSHAPWPAYPYKPDVSFAIAHSANSIFIKFFVAEQRLRAVNSIINSAVYEDSCVEFFVSCNNGEHYYNIEFNCIGTGRVGYGTSRNERELLPTEIIRTIKYTASMKNNPGTNNIHWQLTLAIPLSFFMYENITSFLHQQLRANFYKCGDQLPEPHFLSWNNIHTADPDFHRPEFFGTILFE